MRTALIVAALIFAAGCSKQSPGSSSVVDAGSTAALPSAHGSALPFETGQAPKIEDLKVDDLSKFLVTHPWCTRTAGGSKFTFTQQGMWTQTSATGATEGLGTWTLQNGWLLLAGNDAGSRRVDVETGKVNGREVMSMDGNLYSDCQ